MAESLQDVLKLRKVAIYPQVFVSLKDQVSQERTFICSKQIPFSKEHKEHTDSHAHNSLNVSLDK